MLFRSINNAYAQAQVGTQYASQQNRLSAANRNAMNAIIVGCVEASETMKVILGSPTVLSGKLWHIDLRTLESYVISLV